MEAPPEPKTVTLGSLGVSGSALGLTSSGTWATIGAGSTLSYDQGVNLTCGPVQVTARICSRCHGVYWNSRPKGEWFMSVKALPELSDYMKWQERQAWEMRQRAKNELANRLYQQYQMALKLAYDPGETDEQA